MAVQVKEHVRKFCKCVTFKAEQLRTPMKGIVATHPLQLVHINYLCLEPGKGKEENVLPVVDHFTQYAQAYITESQMVKTMVKVLWDNFIIHCGLLEKILLDQGRNLENELIVNLKLAHRKADLFQWKEAQCPKPNYSQSSKAVSLRMRDMVLVCVTTFKAGTKFRADRRTGSMWLNGSST